MYLFIQHNWILFRKGQRGTQHMSEDVKLHMLKLNAYTAFIVKVLLAATRWTTTATENINFDFKRCLPGFDGRHEGAWVPWHTSKHCLLQPSINCLKNLNKRRLKNVEWLTTLNVSVGCNAEKWRHMLQPPATSSFNSHGKQVYVQTLRRTSVLPSCLADVKVLVFGWFHDRSSYFQPLKSVHLPFATLCFRRMRWPIKTKQITFKKGQKLRIKLKKLKTKWSTVFLPEASAPYSGSTQFRATSQWPAKEHGTGTQNSDSSDQKNSIWCVILPILCCTLLIQI